LRLYAAILSIVRTYSIAGESIMLAQLFRTKSLDKILDDSEKPEHSLKRTLGAFDLILLGIGAIIGAGIFATVGTAAAGDATRPGAGPALVLSFVITGVACAFTALCYAEFAAMVPISGSAYTYSYATLGELIAWIIGWDLIIEYAVGNVAVAISWSGYFRDLLAGFGIEIPIWLATNYDTVYRNINPELTARVMAEAPRIGDTPIIFNLPAVLIVLAITAVLVVGIRESARFNAVMVGIKVIILTFFIGVGVFYIKPENYTPFAPNGFTGIAAGAAIIFFAYIGFDAVSTVAEETKRPSRDMPIGILGSLVICTIFYIIVALVLTGMIPYKLLATEAAEPLTVALKYHNLNAAAGLVAFGSVVAHTAVLLVFQLGQPRIFFSMGRDGLLPPIFSRVHPRFKTPHITTRITGIAVAIPSAFYSIEEMVALTNIGTLFAFILVCLGIIILRVKDPHRHRPFKVPFGPVIPVLGIICCIGLIIYLPPASWSRFGYWLLAGLIIYLLYGRSHSMLNKEQTSK
jgi:basic amino acid/polyamine antiporter, APA family